MPADIPKALEEVTPDWMTGALRQGGVLDDDGAVVALRIEQIGEGEGYMSLVARAHLEYRNEPGTAPSSLVLKMPTREPAARGGGEMLGIYEREIRIYRELAERIPVATPRFYYGDCDPNPNQDSEDDIVRFVERLPPLLVRGLLRLGSWISGRSPRRYILLIEDLDPAEPGDQVAGASVQECARMAVDLARIHGAFWGDGSLGECDFLRRIDTVPKILQMMFRSGRPRFERLFGERLTPSARRIADWLDGHGGELMTAVCQAPETLVHGDYRLDNLFFAAEPRGIVVADWQATAAGPGAYDLAYFLGSSLDAAAGRDGEREVVHAYHDALCAAGVDGYDFERCLADYDGGVLLMLHRMLSVGDSVEFDNPRGQQLIHVWIERLCGLLEGVDPAERFERCKRGGR